MRATALRVLAVLLCLAGLGLAACGCKKTEPRENILLGDEFPLESLPAAKGERLTRKELMDGRVHLMFFITSNCIECMGRLFELRDLMSGLAGDEYAMHIVYIPAPDEDPLSAARREADSIPTQDRVLVDAEARLDKLLFIQGRFPAVVVFDAEGRLASPPIRNLGQKVKKVFTFTELLELVRAGEVDQRFWTKPASCHLVGTAVPDLTLPDSGGRRYNLAGLVGEKNLIINFWSPSCPYCIQELPRLNNFYITNRDRYDFEVYGLVMAPPSAYYQVVEASLKVAAQQNLAFPTLFDSDGESARAFYLEGTPMIMVVDLAGEIRGCEVGVAPEMEKRLAELLSEMQ